jgi:hypothetical protein
MLGNSGSRVGFVSTRLTRLCKRVRHDPDPIINRVETCDPNTTRYTRLQNRSNPSNLIGSSTGKQENSKKNSHLAIMRNSPRKFIRKTIIKIPSTHSIPQQKTRRKNPKNRPEQGYIFKLQQFNPMNPHGSIKTYQSKNTQNNINNGNTRI